MGGGPTHIDGLGPGWESAEATLAAVQADLTRTVPDAPRLRLLSRENGDRRWAYVGKSCDWFHGSGGFALTHDYEEMAMEIANEVSDAVVDTLLGRYAYWPHCPVDDDFLGATVDGNGRCLWVCRKAEPHIVCEVGRLGLV